MGEKAAGREGAGGEGRRFCNFTMQGLRSICMRVVHMITSRREGLELVRGGWADTGLKCPYARGLPGWMKQLSTGERR